jgi:hypothetical protein
LGVQSSASLTVARSGEGDATVDGGADPDGAGELTAEQAATTRAVRAAIAGRGLRVIGVLSANLLRPGSGTAEESDGLLPSLA